MIKDIFKLEGGRRMHIVTSETRCILPPSLHYSPADYVVLENLTSKFSSPSILDLKVGTRQHGDDIPEAKVRKHMKTVAESTSSTLGVRICGMQV